MTDYPLPGEIWKHYKGGTYKIITLATHTETDEVLVVYQSIPFGSMYVRPLSIWEEVIDNVYHQGQPVKRFVRKSI